MKQRRNMQKVANPLDELRGLNLKDLTTADHIIKIVKERMDEMVTNHLCRGKPTLWLTFANHDKEPQTIQLHIEGFDEEELRKDLAALRRLHFDFPVGHRG
jgi:hypothetical protein